MTTTIQNKEKYIEKDGELYDFAGWRIDRKAKKDEWPHFLPMDLARYNHLSETWKLEDMEAKPFGTLANKALKEKNYTLAVELFQKALHKFSINIVMKEKFRIGFNLGTHERLGAKSPVLLLQGHVPVVKMIARYLTCNPIHDSWPRKLVSICLLNQSFALSKLNFGIESFRKAQFAALVDPSYEKLVARTKTALKTKGGWEHASDYFKDTSKRKLIIDSLKDMEQKYNVIKGMISPTVAILSSYAMTLLNTHMNFAVLEQSISMKSLKHFANQYDMALLECSLVPMECAHWTDFKSGQLLTCSLRKYPSEPVFVTTGKPELQFFHIAIADTVKGDDLELPPHGKATTKSIEFVIDRVGEVARRLREHFGICIKVVMLGQGIRGVFENPILMEKVKEEKWPDKRAPEAIEITLSHSTAASEIRDGVMERNYNVQQLMERLLLA